MNYLKFLVILAVSILCSCTQIHINEKADGLVLIFDHPVHGEVSESDPDFVKSKKECRQLAFGKGIRVGDTLVSKHEALLEIVEAYESQSDGENAPPEYLTTIRQSQNTFVGCVEDDKDFKLIRSEVYNRVTGEFVYRVYY